MVLFLYVEGSFCLLHVEGSFCLLHVEGSFDSVSFSLLYIEGSFCSQAVPYSIPKTKKGPCKKQPGRHPGTKILHHFLSNLHGPVVTFDSAASKILKGIQRYTDIIERYTNIIQKYINIIKIIQGYAFIIHFLYLLA